MYPACLLPVFLSHHTSKLRTVIVSDKPLDPAATETGESAPSSIVDDKPAAPDNVELSLEDSVPVEPAAASEVFVEEPEPDEVDGAVNTSGEPLIIDLLRHGQVATPSLFSAPVDEPLGMVGWKQMTMATQNTHWDAIISPPTRRCHDFARLLSQRIDCEFVVDKRYCELDFGDWIGLSQQEILQRDPELLQQYYFQPRRFRAPGGESMDEFSWRLQAAWEALCEQYAGKHVLLIVPAGVVRMILSRALDLLYQKTLRFEVDYARFSRFSVYPDGEMVLSGHGLADVRQLQ